MDKGWGAWGASDEYILRLRPFGTNKGDRLARPPSKPAAPSILTPLLIEKLCAHVKAHNSIITAYRIEGLSDSQFALLMEEAEANPSGLARVLRDRLTQAEAIAEAEGVKAVNALADTGHASAIMWRQERRYGGNWAKSDGKGAKDAGSSGSAAPQIMLPPNGRETKPS
jgi:hypothetical protein